MFLRKYIHIPFVIIIFLLSGCAPMSQSWCLEEFKGFSNATAKYEKETAEIFEHGYLKDDSLLIDEIIFKAKALTISKYGLGLDTMSFKYLKRKLHTATYIIPDGYEENRYLNIVIKNYGKPRKKSKLCSELNSCNYVLIYSFKQKRFYLISGFEHSDYLELHKQVSKDGVDIADILKFAFKDEMPEKYLKNYYSMEKLNCKCDHEMFILENIY